MNWIKEKQEDGTNYMKIIRYALFIPEGRGKKTIREVMPFIIDENGKEKLVETIVYRGPRSKAIKELDWLNKIL